MSERVDARANSCDLGVDRRATAGRPGPRVWSSIRGSGGAANIERCRGQRSRGSASTRPRVWPARPRRADQSCVVSVGSPFSCPRRSAGARRGSRELGVATDEEGEKPKQVEQEDDHRAGILSGSRLRDQPLDRRRGVWRGTGSPCGRPPAPGQPDRSHPRGIELEPTPSGQRVTRTGILECVRTLLVSLPIRTAAIPRRPCEAMKMRSQPASPARVMIAS